MKEEIWENNKDTLWIKNYIDINFVKIKLKYQNNGNDAKIIFGDLKRNFDITTWECRYERERHTWENYNKQPGA